MIPREVIQQIYDAARIEEVVGDFVSLKKRGVNLLGLCPFHDEKTPSFTVSPAKGIFKCFGCGKGGDSVNFIMEHEHFSYPEALKYLARKYGITIVEEEQTPEQIKQMNDQESMFHLSEFAQKYFSNILAEHELGKAVAQSYFAERGISEVSIKKFQLGYCLDEWDAFSKTAVKSGYNKDFLVKTGLSIEKEDGRLIDRFKGRVMFPIHNLSGRVIGFGGRILASDKSKAKYVNSPESEIYNKSKVLYGLAFAKNDILKKDRCLLVEGYTDVISLHQAGIENVVASSGTSLTEDQIKLISRFTKHITVLYDGDAAGIKASFRGIDMILEQGLAVKIVLFPDGEDPDSFARKHTNSEIQDFLENHAVDFIKFKSNVLLEEAEQDPIKKADLIKNIVQSVSLIPDHITRSLYIKECSNLLKVDEQILIQELNKNIRNRHKKEKPEEAASVPKEEVVHPKQTELKKTSPEAQEKEIIRILLNHGHKFTVQKFPKEDVDSNDSLLSEADKYFVAKVNVAEFLVTEILHDEMTFEDPALQAIFNLYANAVEQESVVDVKSLITHESSAIRKTVTDLLSEHFELSPLWKEKNIHVRTEEHDTILNQTVLHALLAFKLRKVEILTEDLINALKTEQDEEEISMKMVKITLLKKQKILLSQGLRRTVIK